MPNAIEIIGVTKTFGPKVAVDHLDLAIPEGSLYGFIGPNGAGKSTTIRMVMSIIFPDAGKLSVLGKASAVESKDRIGYLPEERGVYRKMRVGAFLEYMARLKGVDGSAVKTRVQNWLERVGLADNIKKKCQELSKGMQQKVQFISALIHEPDLIILDEPFSGLDPVNARLMRDLVHEQNVQGRTVIFSTHVMQHAEQICDHIVMINRGKKVLDATLGEIRARYDPRTLIVEPAAEAGAAETLRAVQGVARVRTENGHLEAILGEGVDASSALRAIAGAMLLRRIEVKRVSLEDIFIDQVMRAGGTGAEDGSEEALRASLRENAARDQGAPA